MKQNGQTMSLIIRTDTAFLTEEDISVDEIANKRPCAMQRRLALGLLPKKPIIDIKSEMGGGSRDRAPRFSRAF